MSDEKNPVREPFCICEPFQNYELVLCATASMTLWSLFDNWFTIVVSFMDQFFAVLLHKRRTFLNQSWNLWTDCHEPISVHCMACSAWRWCCKLWQMSVGSIFKWDYFCLHVNHMCIPSNRRAFPFFSVTKASNQLACLFFDNFLLLCWIIIFHTTRNRALQLVLINLLAYFLTTFCFSAESSSFTLPEIVLCNWFWLTAITKGVWHLWLGDWVWLLACSCGASIICLVKTKVVIPI